MTSIFIFQQFIFIRSIGVSNFNIHHLEKLREAVPDEIPSGVNMCINITILMKRMRHELCNMQPYFSWMPLRGVSLFQIQRYPSVTMSL